MRRPWLRQPHQSGRSCQSNDARAAIAQIIMLSGELCAIDRHTMPNDPSASRRLMNFTYPKGQGAHFGIR